MFEKQKKKIEERREIYSIPQTVQQAIPVQQIWKDGIFRSNKTFSKTFEFDDINYQIAGNDDQESMFKLYSALLNSFDSDCIVQITINNHQRNAIQFDKDVLFQMNGDDLDQYRKEYNGILRDHASEGNRIVQKKYITITTAAVDSVQTARSYFTRAGNELSDKLNDLGSHIYPLDAAERLRIFHDFYRIGEETIYEFELKENMRLGRDFRDYICPDSILERDKYMQIGDKYYRSLFCKKFPNYMSDAMIKELCSMDRNMMLTITINPRNHGRRIEDGAKMYDGGGNQYYKLAA